MRQAAARSRGLTTVTTLSRLATGQHTGRITSKTIAGLALALGVSEETVRAAAEADTQPSRWLEMTDDALLLPPERLATVMAVIEAELRAFEQERRDKIKEARPFG